MAGARNPDDESVPADPRIEPEDDEARYAMTVSTATAATRTVSDDEADIRLDRWFRRHFPGVPQSAIQKLCRTGQVRIDGKRAEAATRLVSGQAVRIPPLPAAPMAKPSTE